VFICIKESTEVDKEIKSYDGSLKIAVIDKPQNKKNAAIGIMTKKCMPPSFEK